MNYKQFIEIKNNAILESYKKDIKTLQTIKDRLNGNSAKLAKYFLNLISKIQYFEKLNNDFEKRAIDKHSLKDLQQINAEIDSEISQENYPNSFANPKFCSDNLDQEFGALYAFYYTSILNLKKVVFTKKLYIVSKKVRNLIKVIEAWEKGNDDFRDLMTEVAKDQSVEEQVTSLKLSYDPDLDLNYEIVVNSDLNNLAYLYKYGVNVSDNELKIAEFLQNYDEKKIDELSNSIMKSYIRGIVNANKSMDVRKSIMFIYNVGQERIVRSIVKKMEESGFRPLLSRVDSTAVNKQFDFDHKFDNAFYLDEKYLEDHIATFEKASAAVSDLLELYSGVLYIEKFGESNFSPETNEKAAKLNAEQRKLSKQLRMRQTQIIEKYRPRSETTFCIVAFPVPEIGEKFNEIFADTVEINMLDTDYYEKIQQNLVDVLDKADYVEVIGKGDNKTNVKVKMPKLENPKNQTNFFNCGADVNIPVGEVFTSPQLTGTNGLLHVKTAFLNGLEFKNLEIEFENGFVKNYNCTNFDKEEENKKYIKDNLLFPHETLPLGEFAIGTNTKAYKMAKKYDILPLLPILIVEKMGPHFAIGDTCYTWEEDEIMRNPIDNKEIVAKDNEKSILRKTDISQAYTNCHTDITLPYESLERITIVTYDNERIDAIKDGRFVVEGTEDLNIPLIEMDGWS